MEKINIQTYTVPPFYNCCVRKLTQIFRIINFLLIHKFAYFCFMGLHKYLGVNLGQISH